MLLRDHGAGCCGIKHIYSMDNGTPAELDRLLAGLIDGNNDNRLVEIALSQRQIGGAGGMQDRNPAGGWPAILNARGFRLVSRFRNSNSSNEVFVFHHVPNFLSLDPNDMPGQMRQWRHDYVIPPRAVAPAVAGEWVQSSRETIQVGTRVRLTRTVGRYTQGTTGVTRRSYRPGVDNPGWYIHWAGRDVDDNEGYWPFSHLEVPAPEPVVAPRRGWAVGDRFRYVLNNSRRDGWIGTIQSITDRVNYNVRFDNGAEARLTSTYFRRVEGEDAVAVVAVPTPPAEPVIVFSTYHNVYRSSGRSGSGWDSREACVRNRNAPPYRVDRRDIFSDGSIVWSENV